MTTRRATDWPDRRRREDDAHRLDLGEACPAGGCGAGQGQECAGVPRMTSCALPPRVHAARRMARLLRPAGAPG